ncbi:amidase [Gloeobacter morelensis MG652769]|uniref:Amidase n=2 Tax=Gloeobacter TaxID=33071 RepID=A0ABY3PKL0_9CYAN|nr:amidase [Gloeobacter morelensis MG652769]
MTAAGGLSILLGTGQAFAATCPPAGPPLSEATVAALQEALASGALTSRQIVQGYLDRIACYDKQGPKINAVLEINPDALAIADALDAERRAGRVRGPLHGIPVLIKGNIATGDRMLTTAGSVALVDALPQKDAFIATRLREAGTVLLGKANLTEFANFMSYYMPSGYSSQGGQTLNPYFPALEDNGVPTVTPCGSSAGSGAATAANLTAISIGTETSGSILCPSSFNSLVGIKPTVGLVSRTGIIPISASQDVAGPMTRTVADAAVLLGAIAGYDPADPVTARSVGQIPADYRTFLKLDGLVGVRIGLPPEYLDFLGPETRPAFDRALEVLRAQGAVIVDAPIATTDALFASPSVITVLTYEFKRDLNAYLAKVKPGTTIDTLSEVIDFNFRKREVALKYGQGLLVDSQQRRLQNGTAITAQGYRDALAEKQLLAKTEGIDATIAKYDLDALLFPTYYGSFVGAAAEYPSVIVPAGYATGGLPIGITFLGKAFSEPQLIQYAYAYEQASLARRPPEATP